MNELLILLIAILFIVLLNTFLCSENFTVEESIKKKLTLYIFLTNNCIYCKEFEKNKYDELVKELGNNYDIKKIHLDNNKDLFMKYNIERVPTAILENDDKTIVVKGLNKESVLKAHQELENNNYIENNNYPITYNYQESINNNKKDLLIFLSKKCPHCINYLKNSHDKLNNLLHNDCNIKLIFDDQDNNDLFSKYKIDFVPKAIILSEYKDFVVDGAINYYNIKKTLNDSEKYNNEEYDIKENMTNVDNKKKILAFLSKRCPHCIRYDKETHDKLVSELGDKYNFTKIYDDEEKNEELFNKYDIKYVPKLLIVDENDKVKKIDGQLTAENILKHDDETKQNTGVHMNNFNKSNDQKKKLLVFLSKKCPHCTRYEKDTHDMLEKELGSKYNINKIHDDKKENEELFYKYNIKYVPKILIVDNNDNVKEINGEFTPENIIKHDIGGNLNIDDENKYKNIIDDENIYDENNYNILEDEMFKSKKNHIIIFLSKTCINCVDYLQHIAPNVENEFGKEYIIDTLFIEDKHNNKYLKDFNIKNVPQAFVKYNNSMYYKVAPEINNDNIRKTIKDIKDYDNRKKINNKLNDETDYRKIMDLYTSIAYENKNKNDDLTELLIFLSNKCDTCKDYEKNIYPKLEKAFLNKCKLKKIYYEDNKNLFKEYGVGHVPQGIISMKDKYIPIEDSTAREFLGKLFPGIFKKN